MHSWVGDKQQRAAYEKQLTEVALKASQEKERLRELVRWEAVISLLFAASHRQGVWGWACDQMESKEQELQRSIAFFEKFQATQTARVRVCDRPSAVPYRVALTSFLVWRGTGEEAGRGARTGAAGTAERASTGGVH